MSENEKMLRDLEKKMEKSDFWDDKDNAQKIVQEYTDLKEKISSGGSPYPAVITIIAGSWWR